MSRNIMVFPDGDYKIQVINLNVSKTPGKDARDVEITVLLSGVPGVDITSAGLYAIKKEDNSRNEQ